MGPAALIIPTTSGPAWNIADRVAGLNTANSSRSVPSKTCFSTRKHAYTKSLLAALPGGMSVRTAVDK
jgi:peptide/nickel transport system ATP-binding protein